MARDGDVVRQLGELAQAFNAHDLDAVYAMLAPDYRQYVNGVLAKASRDEARAMDQRDLYDLYSDYRRTVHDVWASGNRGVMEFTIHGTAADGTRLKLSACGTSRFEDGLMTEAHLYFDPTSAFSRSWPTISPEARDAPLLSPRLCAANEGFAVAHLIKCGPGAAALEQET